MPGVQSLEETGVGEESELDKEGGAEQNKNASADSVSEIRKSAEQEGRVRVSSPDGEDEGDSEMLERAIQVNPNLTRLGF